MCLVKSFARAPKRLPPNELWWRKLRAAEDGGEIPNFDFTCRIARRAGLFARLEEHFSKMLQGITENCMHIVVTISHRIFFTILHEKKSCTANTKFSV